MPTLASKKHSTHIANIVTLSLLFMLFFFDDTATTEIYTLSLHAALPIYEKSHTADSAFADELSQPQQTQNQRSEERFSRNAETERVCRHLLEKKNDTPECEELCSKMSAMIDELTHLTEALNTLGDAKQRR